MTLPSVSSKTDGEIVLKGIGSFLVGASKRKIRAKEKELQNVLLRVSDSVTV